MLLTPNNNFPVIRKPQIINHFSFLLGVSPHTCFIHLIILKWIFPTLASSKLPDNFLLLWVLLISWAHDFLWCGNGHLDEKRKRGWGVKFLSNVQVWEYTLINVQFDSYSWGFWWCSESQSLHTKWCSSLNVFVIFFLILVFWNSWPCVLGWMLLFHSLWYTCQGIFYLHGNYWGLSSRPVHSLEFLKIWLLNFRK